MIFIGKNCQQKDQTGRRTSAPYPWRSMQAIRIMKKIHASIKFCVVALLCVLSIPVIEFVGGWRCFPLILLILPAQILPIGIYLFSVIALLILAISSLFTLRHIFLTWMVLLVVVASAWASIFFREPMIFYLYGLRSGFATKVGYPTIRKFADEVSQRQLSTMCGYKLSPELQSIWDDLASRYPFVTWNENSGTIMVWDDHVSLSWGSPLVGHWGFEASLNGHVRDLENPGWLLRVSEDLQFVYYED